MCERAGDPFTPPRPATRTTQRCLDSRTLAIRETPCTPTHGSEPRASNTGFSRCATRPAAGKLMHVTNDEASPGRATTCSFGTWSARARALLRAINADTITLQTEGRSTSRRAWGARDVARDINRYPRLPHPLRPVRQAFVSWVAARRSRAGSCRRPWGSRPVACPTCTGETAVLRRFARSRH
jgi:hypothetical protein